jgi:hypothetical protein
MTGDALRMWGVAFTMTEDESAASTIDVHWFWRSYDGGVRNATMVRGYPAHNTAISGRRNAVQRHRVARRLAAAHRAPDRRADAGAVLYSFWVSPDRSGASYGYVAAGGRGFTGSRDTVGGE